MWPEAHMLPPHLCLTSTPTTMWPNGAPLSDYALHLLLLDCLLVPFVPLNLDFMADYLNHFLTKLLTPFILWILPHIRDNIPHRVNPITCVQESQSGCWKKNNHVGTYFIAIENLWVPTSALPAALFLVIVWTPINFFGDDSSLLSGFLFNSHPLHSCWIHVTPTC